jgi:hypothetical protein
MSDEFYTWSTGDDIQFTKNFNSSEFECPGSDEHKISIDLVDRLQKLRDLYGKSITITSGYRSPEYNAKVGGVENSQHILGRAVDLTAKDLDKLYELCLTLFNAIGDGRKKGKFIHVDNRFLPKGKKAPIKFGY